MKTRQVHLLRRSQGVPQPDDFETVTIDLPPLKPGEVLVENLWMSVDPYMRRCMDESTEDQEPWRIRSPLNGPSIGVVRSTMHAGYAEGDIVESLSGWQQHFISDGSPLDPFVSPFYSIARRDVSIPDARDYLGLFGLASFTAYVGMVHANDCKPGGTVVISSAAGTVGSMACQIARILGFRVVASAGSDDKVRWLLDAIGVDEAINYRAGDLSQALILACPDGIDLVIENASTEHLSACLPLMNELGTILISGLISIYSSGGRAPPVPNFEYVLDRFLVIRAYRYMDYLQHFQAFLADMKKWRHQGKVSLRTMIYDGLEQAPQAFSDLLGGRCWGKPLVRISAPS